MKGLLLAGCLLLMVGGALAQEQGKDYLLLEDFADTPAGQLPREWKWRKQDEDKVKPYLVEGAEGRHYLAARDSSSSVILGKETKWDPQRYPILTWCWRVKILPPGGDERFDHTNDSAAGLYVIFSENWIGMPRQIKYVWSTTLAQGTTGRRNKVGRPFFVVLEGGEEKRGQWAFEQVDLVADHQRFYGKPPSENTLGLGMLTDANSTHSYAEADYADLRVWTREALEQGLIGNYCSCYEDPAAGLLPAAAHSQNSPRHGE